MGWYILEGHSITMTVQVESHERMSTRPRQINSCTTSFSERDTFLIPKAIWLGHWPTELSNGIGVDWFAAPESVTGHAQLVHVPGPLHRIPLAAHLWGRLPFKFAAAVGTLVFILPRRKRLGGYLPFHTRSCFFPFRFSSPVTKTPYEGTVRPVMTT